MSKRRKNAARRPKARKDLLRDRLQLIKKRYEELIVRPRRGLLDGFLDDDGFEELEQAEEELQVLEGYGFGVRM